MAAIDEGKSVRKAAFILAAIAIIEGAWVIWNVVVNGTAFWRYAGFASGRAGNGLGWLLAAFVATVFIGASLRLPSVKANLIKPSALKALALVVAVAAGILEEVIFRKLLMDALQSRGYGVVLQVLASGVAFGAAHGIWGVFGRSMRAAIGATTATGLLGTALAIVYVAAGRSVAPCIVAHFAINALIEPGLVLAATRGEMNHRR